LLAGDPDGDGSPLMEVTDFIVLRILLQVDDISGSAKLLTGFQNDEDDVTQGIRNQDSMQYIEQPHKATEMGHGEVAGICKTWHQPIGRYEEYLKSENINGCGFEWRAQHGGPKSM
jgi:hypothetical protein